MTVQDVIVLIIVTFAVMYFIVRIARSIRRGSCPSCPHDKDGDAINSTAANCRGLDTCSGCPLHDSCHKTEFFGSKDQKK